jgi:hypothetical protein
VSKKKKHAFIESGYSVIFFDPDEYNIIYKQLNPQFDSKTGLLLTDCKNKDTFAAWSFRISGDDYDVPASRYVLDVSLLV